jgi:hypothetical protein
VYYHPTRHDIPQLFNLDDYADARRPAPNLLPPGKRERHDFSEVEEGYDAPTMKEECKRCLRCDLEWLERIGEPMP